MKGRRGRGRVRGAGGELGLAGDLGAELAQLLRQGVLAGGFDGQLALLSGDALA